MLPYSRGQYGYVVPVHYPGPALFTQTCHPVTFVSQEPLEPPVDYNRDCTRGRLGLCVLIVLGVMAILMGISIIVMGFLVSTGAS